MNIMIGTNPLNRGGIASVISVLTQEGFLQKHNITYISSHIEGGALKKLATFITAIIKTTTLLASNKTNILHVHAASHASFVRKSLFLALARVFGSKTIFHLHGGGFDHYATQESSALMRWWIRKTLEKSSKVIVLSDEWARFITQYAPKAKVQVIANFVSLYPPPDSIAEDNRLLFLGRAEEYKGIFELLSAIFALKSTFPHIKLIIAGDGDLDLVKHKIIQLNLTTCVEILGWIGPGEKQQQLQKASIFVLPSYAEGLPMSMLEAMSASKAIIVTSVGGIPSVVHDRSNGLLIPPRNTDALIEALTTLLTDKTLRMQLGKAARQTIAENYSSPLVIAKLSALYDELCANKQ